MHRRIMRCCYQELASRDHIKYILVATLGWAVILKKTLAWCRLLLHTTAGTCAVDRVQLLVSIIPLPMGLLGAGVALLIHALDGVPSRRSCSRTSFRGSFCCSHNLLDGAFQTRRISIYSSTCSWRCITQSCLMLDAGGLFTNLLVRKPFKFAMMLRERLFW